MPEKVAAFLSGDYLYSMFSNLNTSYTLGIVIENKGIIIPFKEIGGLSR